MVEMGVQGPIVGNFIGTHPNYQLTLHTFMMKYAINFILFIYRLLPGFIARLWGRILGRLLEAFKFRQKVMLNNLAVAYPEMTDSEKKQLLHRIYRHFGLLIVEILRLPYYQSLKTDQSVRVQEASQKNFEFALNRLKSGEPMLMLLGHTGNWELAGIYCAQQGLRTNPIVKEMKGEAGNYLLKRIREDNGLTTIPRHQAMKQIFRAFKQGEAVSFILDQNMTSDQGIFASFFGKTACTQSGLAIVAKKSGYPVIPASMVRSADLRSFELIVGEPLEWVSHPDKEQEILLNTQQYNDALEALIRQHPDQWIWMHKRWKTQPEPISR